MSTLNRQQFDALTALKCVVSYNQYGGYCVPMSSHHRQAAQAILAKNVHEPKTIEYLISNCSDGDIVHAGAYYGDFLPALSQACSLGAKIWAFEPNSENFRCAKITTLINDIKNVELIHAGLGERNEQLTLLISDEKGLACGGASQIIPDDQSNTSGGTETVQIVSIDEVIPSDRVISIIQLDVEGHEKQALTGALKTIQRCMPILMLEILPNSALTKSEWLSEQMMQLGYKILGRVHDNVVFVPSNSDQKQNGKSGHDSGS